MSKPDAVKVAEIFFVALGNRDWKQALSFTQHTWRGSKKNALERLSKLFDGVDLIKFRIFHAYQVDPDIAMRDAIREVKAYVAFNYKNELVEKNILFRVICETGADKISIDGDWGVNPKSLHDAMHGVKPQPPMTEKEQPKWLAKLWPPGHTSRSEAAKPENDEPNKRSVNFLARVNVNAMRMSWLKGHGAESTVKVLHTPFPQHLGLRRLRCPLFFVDPPEDAESTFFEPDHDDLLDESELWA